MKKITSIILVLVCIFLFVGCTEPEVYYWEFEKDFSEISEMKIIVTPYGERFQNDTYNVVKEIDLSYASELYKDVTSISMTKYTGSLGTPTGLCIMIKFKNGDFDLIASRESKHYQYREDGTYDAYSSWLVSNRDEFYPIITKYISID